MTMFFVFEARAETLVLLYKLLGALLVTLVVLGGGLLLLRRFFRRLKTELADSRAPMTPPTPSAESPAFMMATFQAVIKQMREQEKELERLHRLERQRAEESQQLAATVMRNMATGLVMLNAQGIITQSNPSAQAVLGHQLLVGRNFREVFWPDHQAEAPPPPVMADVDECLRSGHTFRRLEMNYRAPQGQNMVLGVALSPIRAADGPVTGAICLLTDLTEIKALLQQVRLKENLAALGEMAAGIAHEFKNSLATISGYAQLMQSAGVDEARQYSAKIAGETKFLTRVVTDFLNFSRPMSLVASPVSTRELIEGSFAEIRERGDFPDVSLELRGDLPVLEADSTLLRQAFANLLRNGCEAIPAGQKGARLLVESRVQAGEMGKVVVITFHDEGSGIAPENLEKVFIPFFTTKSTGTGLGLALVHKIVVNHYGKISVESAPGQGTTFTVTLPLEVARRAPDEALRE